MIAWFKALPGPTKGALWMVASAIAFGGVANSVRWTVEAFGLDPIQVTFFRNILNLVFLLPWFMSVGFHRLRTERLGTQFIRGAAMSFGMMAWFTAVSIMNMADATAISYTAPLFSAIGAVLLLGERPGWHRIMGIAAGFVGVLLILRPGFQDVSPVVLWPLAMAVGVSITHLTSRILGATDSPIATAFWSALFSIPVALIPAIFLWQPVPLAAVPAILIVGAFATLGQISLARSFASAEATIVLPFDFTRLLFVSGGAYVIFSQRVDIWTVIGAGVILGATIYIARRQAIKARREREREQDVPVAEA